MQTHNDFELSVFSSFGTGGKADKLIEINGTKELIDLLDSAQLKKPIWLLGYGTNVLISDEGLSGTTIVCRGGEINVEDSLVIADSGVQWDEVVKTSISAGFWGLELMSGIPGGVGAAVAGNIAAYGQAVADSLAWVEVINIESPEDGLKKLESDELGLTYRHSDFQTDKLSKYVIVRAAFRLSDNKTTELEYASAVKVETELNLDKELLDDRRTIILEARKRAGSLIDDSSNHNTAGSFFKNPMVGDEQVEEIIKFDESGMASNYIKKQQQIHGGSASRVSASLVMLAAGYKRGQAWGQVRLHPEHVLKVENMGSATSQQIYDVAQEVIQTVKDKLDIELEPEVRFLGNFN